MKLWKIDFFRDGTHSRVFVQMDSYNDSLNVESHKNSYVYIERQKTFLRNVIELSEDFAEFLKITHYDVLFVSMGQWPNRRHSQIMRSKNIGIPQKYFVLFCNNVISLRKTFIFPYDNAYLTPKLL
jgi:hypothetical protein